MRGPNSRAASSVVGYVLNLAILIAVLTSIAALGVTFFDSTTSPAVENELETVGNDLAGSIQEVDRLVRQSSSTEQIGQTALLSDQITSEDYIVEIINQSYATSGAPPGSEITHVKRCDRSCLVLESVDSDSLTVINYVTRIDVRSTRLPGGDVYIVRPSDSTLIHVVENQDDPS